MLPSIFGACPKPRQIGRVVAGRASGIKIMEMVEVEALIVQIGGILPDCRCICLTRVDADEGLLNGYCCCCRCCCCCCMCKMV